MTWTPKDKIRHRQDATRERELLEALGPADDERTTQYLLLELREAHKLQDAIGARLAYAATPLEHRDLFDRQRAAQALVERLERRLGIKVGAAETTEAQKARVRERVSKPRHYKGVKR